MTTRDWYQADDDDSDRARSNTAQWRDRGAIIAQQQTRIAQLEAQIAAMHEETCCEDTYRQQDEMGKYNVYTCSDLERSCRTRLVGPWSE